MDDVEEIKKLKARYFRGLDSKDWDLYASVFAEDVLVDLSLSGGEVFRGRDTFVAYAPELEDVILPQVESLKAAMQEILRF